MPAPITAGAGAAKVSGSAPIGEEVRVHLHRVDERRVPGGRASRTGDHRDLDVALLEAQPRLVERPGPVHLDVESRLGGQAPMASRFDTNENAWPVM